MSNNEATLDATALLQAIAEHYKLTGEAMTMREARDRFPGDLEVSGLARDLERAGLIEIQVETAKYRAPDQPSAVLSEDQIWLQPKPSP